MADVSRGWVRDRLRLGWIDSVEVALDGQGMTVEASIFCPIMHKR